MWQLLPTSLPPPGSSSSAAPQAAGRLRLLSSWDGSGESNGGDGPIVILILLCILFCFLWTPLLCQRQCSRQRRWNQAQQRHGQQRRNQDAAAEIIRLSLGNLNLLGGFDEVTVRGTPGGGIQSLYSQSIRNMSLEDRREFIQNVLVSKVGARLKAVTERGGLDELVSSRRYESGDHSSLARLANLPLPVGITTLCRAFSRKSKK
jgi:hypothetical protein